MCWGWNPIASPTDILKHHGIQTDMDVADASGTNLNNDLHWEITESTPNNQSKQQVSANEELNANERGGKGNQDGAAQNNVTNGGNCNGNAIVNGL
jgi:hypothetical protein